MTKILFFLLLFIVSIKGFYSQEIARSTIGAFGSSIGNGTISIQQTVGQPSATTFEKSDDGSSIRQGFHQPYYYEIERNELNATIYPNNVIQ
jgi:hypothetical protein